MTKKAINSGKQGMKNKVFKRPIELAGINKVPILDKCPVDIQRYAIIIEQFLGR